jgi:parallel beta-helix repeat protein
MAMKRIFLTVFLLAILTATSFFFTNVNATDTIGKITSDITWTKSNSPYKLTGPVNVNSGVTLTIEAGVTVNLNNYYIQVEGTLQIKGTSSEQIQLNGGEIRFTENSIDWNEQTGKGCIIEYATLNSVSVWTGQKTVKINQNSINGDVNVGAASIVSNNAIVGTISIIGKPIIWKNTITGTISSIGVDTTSSSYPIISSNIISTGSDYQKDGIMASGYARIEDNKISGCSYGIYLYTQSEQFGGPAVPNANILRNEITQNTEGIHVRLWTAMAYGSITPTLSSNTISNNKVGILVEGTGQYLTVDNNNIDANSEYSIKLSEEAGDIKAISNWWGTADKSAISQTIYDSNHDFNLGTVNFEPFLTNENMQAIPDPNAPMPTISSLNSPTSTPFTQPTVAPTSETTNSPTPTSLPSQTGAGTSIFRGVNVLELGIFVALIIIIVLLTVLIVLFLKRRAPSNITG